MREILFRGKRTDNGEWVEGTDIMHNTIRGKLCISGWRANVCMDWFSVDPKTFGEFTGLTDKNGVKIFEGDILQCNNNPQDLIKVVFGEFNVIDTETFENVENVVGWHTEAIPTADHLSKVEPFNLTMPLNRFYVERGEMVVIGNIYDNPELLEVSGNE